MIGVRADQSIRFVASQGLSEEQHNLYWSNSSDDPDKDRAPPEPKRRFPGGDLYVVCGGALRPLLSRSGDEQGEVALAAKG